MPVGHVDLRLQNAGPGLMSALSALERAIGVAAAGGRALPPDPHRDRAMAEALGLVKKGGRIPPLRPEQQRTAAQALGSDAGY